MSYSVQIETLSQIRNKLIIKAKAPALKDRLEKAFVGIQKKASIKGFRPGMAPMTIVKTNFLAEAMERAIRDVMNESFDWAIKQEKLNPIQTLSSELTPDCEKEIAKGKNANLDTLALEWTAEIESNPEFTIQDLTKVSVEVPKYSVTEKEISRTITELRMESAQFTPATAEDIVEEADVIFLTGKGALVQEDGTETPSAELSFENKLYNLHRRELNEELSTQVLGMKINEEKQGEFTIHPEHHDENLRNKKCKILLKIEKFFKVKAPELTDEMATKYGASSVEDLKTKVTQELEKQYEEAFESEKFFRSVGQALEANPFETPELYFRNELSQLLHHEEAHLKKAGYFKPEIENHLKKNFENYSNRALFNTKMKLFFTQLVKQFEIKGENDQEISKNAREFFFSKITVNVKTVS